VVSSRTPAALVVAAMALAACGPDSPRDGRAAVANSPALPADVLRTEARRHLDESERLLRAADEMRGDADARLGGRIPADVRDVYVQAGRLYEAASQERNRAYTASAAARDAWAAEAHERCRARHAPAEEPSDPGR
jgi:hypothetical protein